MRAGLPLFHAAYGAAMEHLPEAILRIHDVRGVRRREGGIDAVHGTSPAARLLCALLRFPPAGRDIPLRVVMEPGPDGETWTREFGSTAMRTHLRAGPAPGLIEERLIPFAAVSRMEPDTEGVTQTLVGFRVLGLPLPRTIWPRLSVRESAEGTRYRFSITVHLPWGPLLVRYCGWLDTDGGS